MQTPDRTKMLTTDQWRAQLQEKLDFTADSHAGRVLELVCGPANAPKADIRCWLSAGEIASQLGIHKSEASRQLRMLEERGFVERRRRGRNILYRSTVDGHSGYAELFNPSPPAVTLISVEYNLHALAQEGFWALSRDTHFQHTKLKIGTREECEQVFESIRQAVIDGEPLVIHDTLAADIERALNS